MALIEEWKDAHYVNLHPEARLVNVVEAPDDPGVTMYQGRLGDEVVVKGVAYPKDRFTADEVEERVPHLLKNTPNCPLCKQATQELRARLRRAASDRSAAPSERAKPLLPRPFKNRPKWHEFDGPLSGPSDGIDRNSLPSELRTSFFGLNIVPRPFKRRPRLPLRAVYRYTRHPGPFRRRLLG